MVNKMVINPRIFNKYPEEVWYWEEEVPEYRHWIRLEGSMMNMEEALQWAEDNYHAVVTRIDEIAPNVLEAEIVEVEPVDWYYVQKLFNIKVYEL